MAEFTELVSLLIPIPPSCLIKSKEFPNCPLIFEDISKNPPHPRVLGRLFSRLCGLAAFSWWVWGVNSLAFTSAVLVVIYSWGIDLNMSSPYYLGIFSSKMVIAILAAVLFVGKLVFVGATNLSIHLSERCYEHISSKDISNM